MKIEKGLIGTAIARIRVMRGLTQCELNQKTNLQTIPAIEQGRIAPKFETLNVIAEALNIAPACIVLLGSRLDRKDKLFLSLRDLTEKTLEIQENAMKGSEMEKIST